MHYILSTNVVLNTFIYPYFHLRLCQKNDRSIVLVVFPASLTIKNRVPDLRVLYPIHKMEFRAMFVYGTNFERERNVFNASASVQLAAGLIVLFVVVTAIILWLLRRKFVSIRNGLQLALLDCLTLTIGGGNLQMENRFNRWFFGTLLFGIFFMMAVFGGNLLDCFVSVADSKVRTFDDLAKTNATINIAESSEFYVDELIEKLRSVH